MVGHFLCNLLIDGFSNIGFCVFLRSVLGSFLVSFLESVLGSFLEPVLESFLELKKWKKCTKKVTHFGVLFDQDGFYINNVILRRYQTILWRHYQFSIKFNF